jgi:hypothetical protein
MTVSQLSQKVLTSLNPAGNKSLWREARIPATYATNISVSLCIAATTATSRAQQQAITLQAASTVTVPAGTRVLLALRSGINTRSAQPRKGVYLLSTFPVVAGPHTALPARVYAQSVVDKVKCAGRLGGRAEVTMHFTSMICDDGTVVQMPGVLDSLPGAIGAKVKDADGDVQHADWKGKDAGSIARGAEAGATVSSTGGAIDRQPLGGAAYGALAGGVTGLAYPLLTGGTDVNLEQGQCVEMVLQRSLILTPVNLATGAHAVMEARPQHSMPRPGHNQLLTAPQAPRAVRNCTAKGFQLC